MASALRVALGHTVRALRSAAGYSQEGFADAVGVHRTYMGTLERGDGNPTLETLELIAQGRLNAAPARRRRGQAPRPGRVAEPSESDR